MPEMHFYIRWPDGDVMRCYSPSTVIREYFEPGMRLTIAALLNKTAEALERASGRVRWKYGFACTRSSDQSADIHRRARGFNDEETVLIVNVVLKSEDSATSETEP